MVRIPILSLSCMLLACGPKNAKPLAHEVFAVDNQVMEVERDLRFAVLGNTRGGIPAADGSGALDSDAPQRVANELSGLASGNDLDFVVFLGDMVRWSRTREWATFSHTWLEVVGSDGMSAGEGRRVAALPVAGDREFLFDDSLGRMGSTFPGAGADIGYNRQASWYTFDVTVENRTWRFMVLDSNREALGSRWREQLNWIPRATTGDYDYLLVFMHHPRVTLANGADMNKGGIPTELIDLVEDSTDILKLRAVFSAGSHTSEFYLPEGFLGVGYFVAGGGGARADSLNRWGDGSAAGYEAIQLEPRFDLALQGEFARQADEGAWPQEVIDHARAEGEWVGFPGGYDADWFPLYGYWSVSLQREGLVATFVQVGEGGAREIYRVDYEAEEGWRAGR